MRLRIIWPGKTRDAHLRALIEEYFGRLTHFVRCDISELRETRGSRPAVGIDRDSDRISDALRTSSKTILLDPGGNEWSSPELAAQIQRWEIDGIKEVAFVVGGPNGVSAKIWSQADNRWSLSRLTLTHEMARLLLLEQLYRAYTIIKGLPYQK